MLVASCVIYSRKRPTQGLLSMLFHLDPLVELCPLFMFLYALTASSRQRRHRLHILAKAFSVFKAWLTNPRTSRSGTSFHVWKDVCIYPCSTIYHYFLLKWPKEVRATRRSGYNLHVLQVAENRNNAVGFTDNIHVDQWRKLKRWSLETEWVSRRQSREDTNLISRAQSQNALLKQIEDIIKEAWT